MHRQVALGVQRHRPEGVVIILRPGQRQNRHGAAIALNQVSDERWQMFTLPRQQNGLIGKMAAGKKKITGVLGHGRIGRRSNIEACDQIIGQIVGNGIRQHR